VNHDDRETEAKFYIRDLKQLVAYLGNLGADLVQERTYEINLRFDNSHKDLQRAHQVLRVRRDKTAHLTYKGPGQQIDGIVTRQEIEVGVDDFETAKRLVEALGFQVIFIYEKYRSVYALADALIMVDELPYGNFIEIESDLTGVPRLAGQLALKWENAITSSYHALFEQARIGLGLTFRDLTFASFADLAVSPENLGIRPAD
jgi:adenylate cyclase, class 2